MIIKEIHSKSVLSPSKIYDYVVNPYVGCQHACTYCYARFMKRFTGHKEPWGDFVDVKINAPDLLSREIKKKRIGTVWVSGVCDPYQPPEAKYKLTRACLKILAQNNWPVVIQTRSPLVCRDLDILKESKDIEVGLSITTANDAIRKIFEPYAPSVEKRLEAIKTLHQSGIKTYVMIAPILPEAENLIRMLAGDVDYIIIDRMNYFHAAKIYERQGWSDKNTYEYFKAVGSKMVKDCAELGVECRSVY
ncbi:MAG TPA: radical SAM protein [Smithella sp.]|nr:radical SAM protein [Smithella sp.]